MAVAKKPVQSTEYELFSAYRMTGDRKLRDELLEHYLYIAEILSRKFINRGADYDDIYQVAVLGVLYAIERFDPDRGVQFATFATPTVLGEIRHFFREMGHFIKVPRKLYDIFYKAEKIRRASDANSGSIEELSRILNIPEKTLRKAYEIGDVSFIRSLEDEAYADGPMLLSNTIGREDNHFMMIEDRDFIRSCLAGLSEKEREFVTLRYYDELSQSEISKRWGISQTHVSRFERTLLKKLNQFYFNGT
ncbi:MAG: sigma-70 family RNA polymerase sigma factor [Ruminococcaceae bacterium]|nr:sigma-70 family RNA polymerase sigma factor [Oscillospiraceae bacterium]